MVAAIDPPPLQTFVGFDSAWTDNPKAPGAVCAVVLKGCDLMSFHPPQLTTFADALKFIEKNGALTDFTLVALDQPTIVPNIKGMRPVEKAVGSLIGWLGGGVQPTNRGRKGMFCDASPIWEFLDNLNAQENPEEARTSNKGLYIIEVFPALSLPSLAPEFFGRLAAPKYNPKSRKTFRQSDWKLVTEVAAMHFDEFGMLEPAEWCRKASHIIQPRKADQDRLDAMLCLMVALHWRLRDRENSIMLGNLQEGYMVSPISPQVRSRLETAAYRVGVCIT